MALGEFIQAMQEGVRLMQMQPPAQEQMFVPPDNRSYQQQGNQATFDGQPFVPPQNPEQGIQDLNMFINVLDAASNLFGGPQTPEQRAMENEQYRQQGAANYRDQQSRDAGIQSAAATSRAGDGSSMQSETPGAVQQGHAEWDRYQQSVQGEEAAKNILMNIGMSLLPIGRVLHGLKGAGAAGAVRNAPYPSPGLRGAKSPMGPYPHRVQPPGRAPMSTGRPGWDKPINQRHRENMNYYRSPQQGNRYDNHRPDGSQRFDARYDARQRASGVGDKYKGAVEREQRRAKPQSSTDGPVKDWPSAKKTAKSKRRQRKVGEFKPRGKKNGSR